MFAPDLSAALARALLPGDVVALPAGVHSVTAGLHLPDGVSLMGLDPEDETVLAVRTYAEDGSDIAGGYHVIAGSGVTLHVGRHLNFWADHNLEFGQINII